MSDGSINISTEENQIATDRALKLLIDTVPGIGYILITTDPKTHKDTIRSSMTNNYFTAAALRTMADFLDKGPPPTTLTIGSPPVVKTEKPESSLN